MQQYVLIVAGGKGERMENSTPKQFIELNGRPLLMLSMEAFAEKLPDRKFVVILPVGKIADWKNLCQLHHFQIEHEIAEGGPKRFHSVKSGLKLVPDNVLVAIHDANRPFVSKETIQRCFEMAKRKGNAVPVIHFSESVREISGVLSQVVDRSKLRIVQTPQIFNSTQIKKAYMQNYEESFTDDASVLEKAGYQVNLVEGNSENFKITHPADIILAQQFLDKLRSLK